MTILDTIVATKQQELQELQRLPSDHWYRNYSAQLERECISLRERLLAEGSTGIIAEFKRRSPSKGWFKPADYASPPVVKAYETWGAAGSSVLTDTNYFGGSLDDLSHSRKITSLPLLRKDFIIDELQVVEAKAHGADVILLIAAILSPERAEELASMARWFGMEVLLEVHEESELDRLNEYIDMVGVNNRDLRDFSVRIERSLELIQKLPAQLPAVSESGISDAATISRLRAAGYKGFLVGENFMKQDDPAQAFQDFVNKLEK